MNHSISHRIGNTLTHILSDQDARDIASYWQYPKPNGGASASAVFASRGPSILDNSYYRGIDSDDDEFEQTVREALLEEIGRNYDECGRQDDPEQSMDELDALTVYLRRK